MSTSGDLAFLTDLAAYLPLAGGTMTGPIIATQASRGNPTIALRLATLDTDFPGADWGFVFLGNPGSNGETRFDNQFTWGYNVGPNGRLNTSEHAYGVSMESRYKTGPGIIQFEHYHFYNKADGSDGGRPFGIVIN